MKSIVVQFNFPNKMLEGYEDVCDELIIEDFLRSSEFAKSEVGWQIQAQPEDLGDRICTCGRERSTVGNWCPIHGQQSE